jgi:flagellar hook-associated protein 3 FlgL
MTISNVSTFGSLQTLLQNMGTVQTALNNDQVAISSGQASQTFDGISSSVEQLTSLNAQIARLTGYQQENGIILGQMQTTNTVLGQIVQLATNVKSLIANQISGTSSGATFIQQLQSQMSTLTSELNSTYGQNFLFGGTVTNIPPVKQSIPLSDIVGQPDANYYQGSDQDMTARITDSQIIVPGVRANNMAFQQLFAGIRQAINAISAGGQDTGALENAENLVDQGMQGAISLQSTVNSNILTVQQANSQSASIQTYFKGIVTNITSADVVTLSTQVAQDSNVLQASFATFARISSLSLTNYLK